MPNLPVITGVLTVVLIGGVGVTLISAEQWLWGGVALAFAGVRLVLLVGQIWRRLPIHDDED